jgi:hypothetical protein
MNELDNNSQAPPHDEADIPIPAEPLPGDPAESREIHPPEVTAPPLGKKPRVAQKFGTWRWFGLFLIGLFGFFLLNTLIWSIIPSPDPVWGEPIVDLMCLGPIWLLINLVIFIVLYRFKLYPMIFGYLVGYILNFIFSLILQTISYSICGSPFYLSFFR